jgi:hypothetical protein
MYSIIGGITLVRRRAGLRGYRGAMRSASKNQDVVVTSRRLDDVESWS